MEELAAAAAAVAVRAQVREVSTQLGLSMQVLHHEALAMALQRATALDMGSVPEFAPTVAAAVALDAKLTEVRGGLRAGIEAVDRAALGLALDGAAELGLAHYEQPAAAHLAAEIERLLEAAAVALDSMDPSDLGAVLGEADALRLREPPIEKVRETLGLPAERFLSEQLKAAKRHGDIPREDALNTAIKDLIFERSGDAFDLAKLPRLRTADEFANAKMGGKKERREGFLRHQAKPIPTSLTQLDSKEKREGGGGDVQIDPRVHGRRTVSVPDHARRRARHEGAERRRRAAGDGLPLPPPPPPPPPLPPPPPHLLHHPLCRPRCTSS